MLFQSPLFSFFFLTIVLLISRLPTRRYRHWILLIGSYAFYAAWDARFLSLLFVSTIVDFIVGRRLSGTAVPRTRKLWLALSVATNLGILGIFKYFDFFSESAAELSSFFGVHLTAATLDVVLPVGISFYTFQSMSYTIDIYRRQLQPDVVWIFAERWGFGALMTERNALQAAHRPQQQSGNFGPYMAGL